MPFRRKAFVLFIFRWMNLGISGKRGVGAFFFCRESSLLRGPMNRICRKGDNYQGTGEVKNNEPAIIAHGVKRIEKNADVLMKRSESGSVIMEYVILNALIFVPLIGLFALPNSISQGEFGIVLEAMLARFQLMRYVVSMPFP
jgi:hypothetical protein